MAGSHPAMQFARLPDLLSMHTSSPAARNSLQSVFVDRRMASPGTLAHDIDDHCSQRHHVAGQRESVLGAGLTEADLRCQRVDVGHRIHCESACLIR